MSGNTTDPGDRSSAEIEREVEGTRAQLNETLGALRESASPGQLMDRAVDYLRGSGGADFTRNLGETVRDNPLPVLLIGAGIGWLLLSGKQDKGRSGTAAEPQRLLPAPTGIGQAETRRSGAVRVAPAGGNEGPSLAERASSTAGAVRERAGAVAGGARDTASDMAGRAGDAMGGAYRAAADTAGSAAESVGTTAQSAVQRAGELGQEAREQAGRLGESAQGLGWLLREQPLVLGALGVALGAAVGAVLPGTRTEDRLMGETSDAVAEKATAAAQQVSGRAQEVAGEHLERVKSAVGETYEQATAKLDEAGLSAGKIGETIGQAAQDVRQGVRQAAQDTAAEAHKAVGSGGDTAPSPGQAGRAEGPGQATGTGAGAGTTSGRPSNPV